MWNRQTNCEKPNSIYIATDPDRAMAYVTGPDNIIIPWVQSQNELQLPFVFGPEQQIPCRVNISIFSFINIDT